MTLCLLMVISAILTNSVTVGLLLWAKQKRPSRFFFALRSNCPPAPSPPSPPVSMWFHLGIEFVFSLPDAKMKCHSRTRISYGLKTGMKSFRNDLYGTKFRPGIM